jgi:hypothetical protein
MISEDYAVASAGSPGSAKRRPPGHALAIVARASWCATQVPKAWAEGTYNYRIWFVDAAGNKWAPAEAYGRTFRRDYVGEWVGVS